MRRATPAIATICVVLVLALTGCSTTPTARHTTGPDLTAVPEAAPRPTSAARPLAEEIARNVLVSVYYETTIRATHGCGCSLKGDKKDELFPAGTPVMVVKITLTGTWSPDQGNRTTQDVTGMTFTGTRFEGRPEDAVLDGRDGAAVADKLRLPWMPQGLFGARSWKITNNQPAAFAAAWYVPAGVNRLDLTVNIPSEKHPTNLFVDLPTAVLHATAPGGE